MPAALDPRRRSSDFSRNGVRRVWALTAAALAWLVLGVGGLHGQALPDTTPADAQRITRRLADLRRESQDLAQQARTLVGDIRRLEIERDIQNAEAARADAAAARVRRQRDAATLRLAALEARRVDEQPTVDAQLVELYKTRRGGYARLLLGAADAREFARTARAVSALAEVSRQRLDRHQQTLDALRRERGTLERAVEDLRAKEASADTARRRADRALADRAILMNRIDGQRDLYARYMGELQVAYDRLQAQVASGEKARLDGSPAVPLGPFKGALDPPVRGRVVGRFGDGQRPGGAAVRNGVDYAVPERSAVRAVHGGTVAFAGPFAGFGTLVILDHGGGYSLYGYLASTPLAQGERVESGAEVGVSGLGPDGRPGVYFELRVEGQPVDPVQWLAARG